MRTTIHLGKIVAVNSARGTVRVEPIDGGPKFWALWNARDVLPFTLALGEPERALIESGAVLSLVEREYTYRGGRRSRSIWLVGRERITIEREET